MRRVIKARRTAREYALSLHDALPISGGTEPALRAPGGGARTLRRPGRERVRPPWRRKRRDGGGLCGRPRSEEHTSELQSRFDLVCRLLLEKKKQLEVSGGIATCTNLL